MIDGDLVVFTVVCMVSGKGTASSSLATSSEDCIHSSSENQERHKEKDKKICYNNVHPRHFALSMIAYTVDLPSFEMSFIAETKLFHLQWIEYTCRHQWNQITTA